MKITKQLATIGSGGTVAEQHEAFKRAFGNIPLTDATHELQIVLLPSDLEGATREDPENCALARACRRQFDATISVFLRTRAYIDIPDEEGARRAVRFMFDAGAREAVRKMDLEGAPDTGRLITLKPPTPGRRLNYKHKYEHEYRERQKARKEALLKGELTETQEEQEAAKRRSEGAKKAAQNRIVRNGRAQLRDGRGMVQMLQLRADTVRTTHEDDD